MNRNLSVGLARSLSPPSSPKKDRRLTVRYNDQKSGFFLKKNQTQITTRLPLFSKYEFQKVKGFPRTRSSRLQGTHTPFLQAD